MWPARCPTAARPGGWGRAARASHQPRLAAARAPLSRSGFPASRPCPGPPNQPFQQPGPARRPRFRSSPLLSPPRGAALSPSVFPRCAPSQPAAGPLESPESEFETEVGTCCVTFGQSPKAKNSPCSKMCAPHSSQTLQPQTA
ncbi:anther-specific proline-rich protein APG-like [Prionailurus viverrinus]|uniref:anther-specific proline-rich protein APG-like n=1 Tax=Prionailurus viverrinus TaxID=61388 RepID=UPI001FF3D64D|nr:anther-specific proline-rich protein APG-like [Prionailurus viverrinus]XP_047709289.1 anther-specific proline-rich protein APG-like [Prionailurus viverrinus]